MKPLYFIAGVFIIALLTTSCYPLAPDPYYVPVDRQMQNIYYAPVTLNAPLLQGKNEGNIGTTYSFGNNHQGIDLQASYSPAEHLGLISNFTALKTGGDAGDMNRFELGVGYYSKLSEISVFEVYAGGGLGKVKNRHFTGYSNFSNTVLFFQPSIGLQQANRKLQVAFVPRVTYVHYDFKDSTFSNDREQYVSNQFRILADKPNQVFFEPGIVFKAGGDNTLVNLGCNFSANLTSPGLNDVGTHFHAGVNFRLFPSKKKLDNK